MLLYFIGILPNREGVFELKYDRNASKESRIHY